MWNQIYSHLFVQATYSRVNLGSRKSPGECPGFFVCLGVARRGTRERTQRLEKTGRKPALDSRPFFTRASHISAEKGKSVSGASLDKSPPHAVKLVKIEHRGSGNNSLHSVRAGDSLPRSAKGILADFPFRLSVNRNRVNAKCSFLTEFSIFRRVVWTFLHYNRGRCRRFLVDFGYKCRDGTFRATRRRRLRETRGQSDFFLYERGFRA